MPSDVPKKSEDSAPNKIHPTQLNPPDDLRNAVTPAAIPPPRNDFASTPPRETIDPNAPAISQLSTEPANGSSGATGSPLGAFHPERIGRYRILSVLGRGGMGVVYEAEQDQPRRNVALKVVAPHMLSQHLLRRFEMEAEVLGRLEHPGIAQVYEAGTADAGSGPQPFFAMELVRGVPLNVYADQHKLDVRRRLELLAKVCDAVHHAHQKGVIHRDLKSANILITSDGQPKVLDFGVARATDADIRSTTMETGVGQLIGTLPYMSPEQAGGDPLELDTRSDVYGLGVVAYELLTGRLPYTLERRLVHEAVRIIREEEPSRLSSVSKALAGDVETIVTKAMEKDKSRRYQSASDMAADVRHFLHDEPVTARPASAAYQLRKFARRNRTLVGGAAAVVAVMILGIAATSWQAVRARRGETRARENAGEARRQEQSATQHAADAERRWAESLVAQGNALVSADRWGEGCARIEEAHDKFVGLHLSPLEADMALWNLYRASPPALMEFKGHAGPLTSVAVSDDGRRGISGSRDGTLKFWDLSTGRLLRTFTTSGVVSTVAILPGGHGALSGGTDGMIHLWDLDTGLERTTYVHGNRAVKCLAVSPDGGVAVSGSIDADDVKIWNLRTGRLRWSFTAQTPKGLISNVTGVAITRDGLTAVISTFAGDVSTCDLASGVALHRFSDPRQAGFGMSMALHPDSQRVALGAADGTVTIWDLPTAGKLRTIAAHHNTVTSVAFSPDGKNLLSGGSDATIKLTDLASGNLVANFFHDAPVMSVAISPSGSNALSGSFDGSMRSWALGPRRESRILAGGASVFDNAAFCMDGRVVAMGRSNASQPPVLIDVATGNELRSIDGVGGQVFAVSPDGHAALCGGGFSFALVDATGEKAGRTFINTPGNVIAVALSQDGRTALSISSGDPPMMRWWDLNTGKEIRQITGHSGVLTCVAISPDGQTALSGSRGGTVQWWELNSGKELRKFAGHSGKIDSVIFSPDGRAALSADDTAGLKRWELSTGTELNAIANLGGISHIAMPAGGDVAIYSTWDGTLKTWDLRTGRELSTVRQSGEGVFNAAFETTGRSALSWGTDRALRLSDFSRVRIYRDFKGRFEQSRAALQNDPDNGPSQITLGEWYAFRGEWSLATYFLERAQNAGSPIPHLTLARCYWQLNRPADARREFQRALDGREAPQTYISLCIQATNRTDATTTRNP